MNHFPDAQKRSRVACVVSVEGSPVRLKLVVNDIPETGDAHDNASDHRPHTHFSDPNDGLEVAKREFWKWYPYDCNGSRRGVVPVSSWHRLQFFKLHTKCARKSIVQDVKAIKNSKVDKFQLRDSAGLLAELTEHQRAVTEAVTAVEEAKKLKVWKRKTAQAEKHLEWAKSSVSTTKQRIDATWKRYFECSCCEDHFDVADCECDHLDPHFYVLVGIFLQLKVPDWYTALGGDSMFHKQNPFAPEWSWRSTFVNAFHAEQSVVNEWTQSMHTMFRDFHKNHASVQLLCRQCHHDKTEDEFRGLQTSTYGIYDRPQPIIVPGKLSKKRTRDNIERERIDADRQVRGPSLYANLKHSLPTHEEEESPEKCALFIEAVNALPDWALCERQFQRYILLGVAYLRFFDYKINVVECLEQKLRMRGFAT